MPEREILDDVTKGTDEELWYGFDFGLLGYLATGDTISEVSGVAPVWTIEDEAASEDPVALETDDDAVDAGATQALVRLTGGTAGLSYLVSVLATTTPGGDKIRRTMRVRCVER